MDGLIKSLVEVIAHKADIATIVSLLGNVGMGWLLIRGNRDHAQSVKSFTEELRQVHESCREERREMLTAMTSGMNHQAQSVDLLTSAVGNLRVAVASKTGVEI